MRSDMLDFPTAWEIQETVPMEHGTGCSSDPRTGPMAGPALLCDCGAITTYWERFVADPAFSSGVGDTKEGSNE